MPEQITPYIEQFYEDAEIWPMIQQAPYLQQQFQEPDIIYNTVVVVLPMVRRMPGYLSHQFDLYLFIKHHQVTDLGQLELYRVKRFHSSESRCWTTDACRAADCRRRH